MEFTLLDAEGRKEFFPALSDADKLIGGFLFKFGGSTWDNFRFHCSEVLKNMQNPDDPDLDYYSWEKLIRYSEKFAAIESRIRQFELLGLRPEFSLGVISMEEFVLEQKNLNNNKS